MKQERDNIFVWPSWISKIVSGEDQCMWKYWFKAHYTYDKQPSDFNLARWTINHNALLQKRRKELENDGLTILVEDQNAFKLTLLKGQHKINGITYFADKDITISGKADIVALNTNTATVEDTKTGKPKTSDHVQVIFYMLFLPLAIEAYKELKFKGTIVYKDGVNNVPIPASAAYEDEALQTYIWNAIFDIAGNEAHCRKVPSENECKKCDICKKLCEERIGI